MDLKVAGIAFKQRSNSAEMRQSIYAIERTSAVLLLVCLLLGMLGSRELARGTMPGLFAQIAIVISIVKLCKLIIWM
jgi:hypothetical protein